MSHYLKYWDPKCRWKVCCKSAAHPFLPVSVFTGGVYIAGCDSPYLPPNNFHRGQFLMKEKRWISIQSLAHGEHDAYKHLWNSPSCFLHRCQEEAPGSVHLNSSTALCLPRCSACTLARWSWGMIVTTLTYLISPLLYTWYLCLTQLHYALFSLRLLMFCSSCKTK